ncbi:hypothetical protein NEOLI_004005 [Neolecta irregularis DAH-3]|uniref:Uncharacterized protein n=1 Tax=Neolecta irregularis (strain DAH-3) TaxID=1198029 RepID=A0A1U7LPF6_NEOID|nr:hypothetical protein NEOLI_004005 [Neolecta irregularis DAH-3]|eukprot:OLL24519.1 hypothetical protein NEOLI_004005 [Neolecta irregularis DAH-3]
MMNSPLHNKNSKIHRLSEPEYTTLRFGLPSSIYILLLSTAGASWGFALGGISGAGKSALQYRAENAHRMPRTNQEWVMLGAIKSGARYAGKIGFITGCFGATEVVIDKTRGTVDAFTTMLAGLSTALAFSLASTLAGQTATKNRSNVTAVDSAGGKSWNRAWACSWSGP